MTVCINRFCSNCIARCEGFRGQDKARRNLVGLKGEEVNRRCLLKPLIIVGVSNRYLHIGLPPNIDGVLEGSIYFYRFALAIGIRIFVSCDSNFCRRSSHPYTFTLQSHLLSTLIIEPRKAPIEANHLI